MNGNTIAPTSEPLKPKPMHGTSWRKEGVFGREDLELALGPWDYGNDEPQARVPSPASRESTMRPHRESLSSSGMSTPPHRTHSRRIRDEEAQYALQEDVGSRCNYYEGPENATSEEEELEKDESENEMEESESSDRRPSSSEDQRHPDSESRRSSISKDAVLDRVAPPLLSMT
jgi:hypothetical protein